MWGRDFNMNGAFERRTRVKEFENLLIQLEKVYGRALPHISRLQEFSTHTHVLLFQQRKESELQNEGIEKEIDAIQKVGVDECAGAGFMNIGGGCLCGGQMSIKNTLTPPHDQTPKGHSTAVRRNCCQKGRAVQG